MSHKTKIILDTNFVWKNNTTNLDNIFNDALENTCNFIEEHNITDVRVSIPEVVIQERLTQQNERIKALSEKTREYINSLNTVGFTIEIPDEDPNYKGDIEGKARENLEGLGVEILTIPEIDQDVLMRRAFEKVKPFSNNNKGGDAGFKDTLIWLSIIEDVKNNQDTNYVICTNNSKDFVYEDLVKEYREHTNKALKIVADSQELQEYLDTELNLELDLHHRNEQVKNEFSRYIGKLNEALNTYVGAKRDRRSLDFSALDIHADTRSFYNGDFGYTALEYRYRAFDFVDMDIKSISEMGADTFKINLELDVMAYENNDSRNTFDDEFTATTLAASSYLFNSNNETKHRAILDVVAIYDNDQKSITIQSVIFVRRRTLLYG